MKQSITIIILAIFAVLAFQCVKELAGPDATMHDYRRNRDYPPPYDRYYQR